MNNIILSELLYYSLSLHMFQAQLFKLIIIFILIIGLVLLKRPLGQAILASAAATILLFRIPVRTAATLCLQSIYEKDTLILIVNFLLVTFLQRTMENRRLLERAELALQRLSGNRRIVCIAAPVIIGFLPSAGAVNICGKIVDDIVGDDLSVPEKTFVASYYRHISESFSPTYNSVILALSLTGIGTGSFVMCMLPLVMILILLGYIFYLRKIPSDLLEKHEKYDVLEEYRQLLYCFWPLAACILTVIIFNVSIIIVLICVIIVSIIVYKLSGSEIIRFARSSFETRIIFNTIVLMMFKNLISYTGVMENIPSMFKHTSLPLFVAFGALMLFGSIISGANAMIVLIIPLAFSAIPGAGTPLLVFLVALSYIAMQISPTHICLAVITEYFHVSWADLVAKTLPVALTFIAIVHVYYIILTGLGL